MILEESQWHTCPCPATVSKQFNAYRGRANCRAAASVRPLNIPYPLAQLHLVSNSNDIASNPPVAIRKRQISLRPTATTTSN